MLTDAQVVQVRERYAAGELQVDLAAAFGVKQNTVSSIVLGRSRVAAGGPIAPAAARKVAAPTRARPAGKKSSPLTPEVERDIRTRVAAGESRAAVAAAVGVSIHTVHSIMSGRRRARPSADARQFSEAKIVLMRTLFRDGASQSELAARFDTQQQAVSQIVRGTMYGSYGGPIAGAKPAAS